jgi:cytochrome c oxidase subunit 2
MVIYAVIASAILIAISFAIDWFPRRGSPGAHQIDVLWDVLMVVSIPIFVLVMTVAIYSVIRFRARPGDTGDGAPIHGNAQLEVVWVLVPFLIVASLAAYAWIVLDDLEAKKPNEMTVHVVGQQFEWTYEYKAPNGKTVRSSELYLPVNRAVKFNINTKDVIHSFWVEEFRLKSDAVPGITTTWRARPDRIGPIKVTCTELCGAGHSTMRTRGHVVSQREFNEWLAKRGGGAAPAAGGGGAAAAPKVDPKQVFTSAGCAGCHQLAAAGSNGTTGPSLDNLVADAKKYGNGKAPDAYVRESIVNPNAFVVPGFPRGTMPQTFGKDLSPDEIKALVDYLLKSGGGKTQ